MLKQPSTRRMPRACLVGAIFLSLLGSAALAAPRLRITYPDWYANLGPNAGFNVLGNVTAARYRNPGNDQWVVVYPRVLLEFFFENGTVYLLNSSTTGVEFPDADSTRGTFDGRLTATKVPGAVNNYFIWATALDPFNAKTNVDDLAPVFVADSGPPPTP